MFLVEYRTITKQEVVWKLLREVEEHHINLTMEQEVRPTENITNELIYLVKKIVLLQKQLRTTEPDEVSKAILHLGKIE